jgi:Flp pilus assembly protein TadG
VSLHRSRPRGDDGNAIVEFSFLGVLLLVPLVYAILIVLQIQKSSYAVTAATREAGRVFVTAGAHGSAYDQAFAAARIAMRDQGLDLAPGQLVITCQFSECATAGGAIHVRIDRDVALPLLPSFGQSTPSVAVHGRHDEVLDCFTADAALPPPGATTCG